VSEEFMNSDGKNALASIAWTFCNDSIDEVIIKVDNKMINQLQDYQFNKIDKSINVNYVFETSYLFESDFITILHNEGEFLKPVTYFYKDQSNIDFMVSKLLDNDIIKNNAYTYNITENELTLNLTPGVHVVTWKFWSRRLQQTQVNVTVGNQVFVELVYDWLWGGFKLGKNSILGM
jgi:hypothetical protein